MSALLRVRGRGFFIFSYAEPSGSIEKAKKIYASI